METQSIALTQKMVRKANQISNFFESYPEKKAIEGVADHLNRFWTADMRQELISYISNNGDGLNELVIKAAALIKK